MTTALENVGALVTGANGRIGKELCKAMKAAHATVVATGLGATAAGETSPPDLSMVESTRPAWSKVG